jgi:hypothetical protein
VAGPLHSPPAAGPGRTTHDALTNTAPGAGRLTGQPPLLDASLRGPSVAEHTIGFYRAKTRVRFRRSSAHSRAAKATERIHGVVV